jgi:hypothetical protein
MQIIALLYAIRMLANMKADSGRILGMLLEKSNGK